MDTVGIKLKNPFSIIFIDAFKAFVRRTRQDLFYIAIDVTFLDKIDKIIEYKWDQCLNNYQHAVRIQTLVYTLDNVWSKEEEKETKYFIKKKLSVYLHDFADLCSKVGFDWFFSFSSMRLQD